MPRKIRDLIADLKKNGFVYAAGRGKGSHRIFTHVATNTHAQLCGHDGDDADKYLEKHVKIKIQEAKNKTAK